MAFPLVLGAAVSVAQQLLSSQPGVQPQAKQSLLDRIALNPQPLPPRDAAREALPLSQRLGQFLDEFCGTVPRRLPPPPPPPIGGGLF